jgi:hypothetical protein
MKRLLKLLICATALSFLAVCSRPVSSPEKTTKPTASASSSATTAAPTVTDGASFKPKRGYVPDEQAAIAIAVAVWIPIYGKAEIEGEKPYHATLKDGVWTVTGSLPEGYNGGTAFAEIAQDDGRILRVTHYQ